MSRYDCGSDSHRWWIRRTTRGDWCASPPFTSDGPNLASEYFPTFREAMDHFVVTQRYIEVARFADLLRGGAE